MAGKYLASGVKPTVSGKMWKTGTNSYAVKLGSAYPQMVDAATACVILKQAGESNVLEEVTKLASNFINGYLETGVEYFEKTYSDLIETSEDSAA